MSAGLGTKMWKGVKGSAVKGWNAVGIWIDRQFGGPQANADGELVHDFKPDADSVEQSPIPISTHAALYVVVGAIVFAIVWSIFGTLDRIVIAQGRIVTDEPMLVMQPLTTSRIEKVHVRAGDHVVQGQLLISFDPAFAAADQASLQQRLDSLEAEIARIEAELSGAETFALAEDGPEWQSQAQLFAQRRSQFSSELAVRDARRLRAQAQIEADEGGVEGLTRQLELARRVAEIRRELQARDAGSMLELMAAEKDEIDFDLRLMATIASRDQAIQSLAEINSERQSFLDQWNGALNERLVSARQELSQASENLNKARRLAELTELRAPLDAIVLELAERSEGSVLREAETLITLVPDDARLSIEADILSRDVGFIAEGDPVRVKLEAYPFQQYGTLEGRLNTVSPDSVSVGEGENSNVVFHAAIELEVTAADAAEQGIRLRPGLIAAAEIKAGEHSIISYVLDPILRIRDEGMREP